MKNKLTSYLPIRILLRGLRQSVYALLCCATGIAFGGSYELNLQILLSFRIFWPMLAAVFLSKTVSEGVYYTAAESTDEPEYRISPIYAVLSLVPLIVAYIVLLPKCMFPASYWILAVVIAAYAAINFLLGMTFRSRENFCAAPGTSSRSIRYTVVLKMVLIVSDTTVGAFVPLAVYGYRLTALFSLLWLAYIGFWFATRRVRQGDYDKLHMPIFVVTFFLGVAFFLGVYVIARVDEPTLTIPIKCFFVGYYLGLYLALPEAFGHTWATQDRNEEDIRKHFALLKAILVVYDPFVYVAFIWLRLSTVFILWYAVGTAILAVYVSRKRRHPGKGRAVFCIGALALLFLEFSGTFQTVALFPTTEMGDSISTFVDVGSLVIAFFPDRLLRLRIGKGNVKSGTTGWKFLYHTSLLRERAMSLFIFLIFLHFISAFIGFSVRMHQCVSGIGISLTLELLGRFLECIFYPKDDIVI